MTSLRLKQTTRILLAFFLCNLIFQITFADIRPASLFKDGMVLQQKTKVKIWGWSTPNAAVTVKTSWSNHPQITRSDSQGKWQLLIKTPKCSFQKQELTISDGNTTTPLHIQDVLIGEVWIAAGQSNMEMPLKGFDGCPIENSAKYIQEAKQYTDKIHFAQVAHTPSVALLDTTKITWSNCTPETVKDFSAVGYFFGTQLTNVLHCPIGIISCNYGGSRTEGWTPRELAATYPGLDLSDSTLSRLDAQLPIILYNGMFHPIVGYSVKGFIWYQGEGNVENYDDYATRLHHMILRWRQEFGQGNLPFLAVEIAPCSIYKGRASGRASRLREAQWTVFHNTPNTGMICTNDLVRPDEQLQVHPSKKYEVGLRLSNLALNKVYKRLKTPVDYPEFKKMEVQGSKAILSFTNCKKGFSKNDNIIGFEICGENNVYIPAQAIIKGNLVEVSSNKVTHPQKVRYAFQDFMLGNLKNKEGLPVVPFRSAF